MVPLQHKNDKSKKKIENVINLLIMFPYSGQMHLTFAAALA